MFSELTLDWEIKRCHVIFWRITTVKIPQGDSRIEVSVTIWTAISSDFSELPLKIPKGVVREPFFLWDHGSLVTDEESLSPFIVYLWRAVANFISP